MECLYPVAMSATLLLGGSKLLTMNEKTTKVGEIIWDRGKKSGLLLLPSPVRTAYVDNDSEDS